MGMYTELFLSCRVKNDPVAVQVLKYMSDIEASENAPGFALPHHPFFTTARWSWMFHSVSFYFVPKSICIFEQDDIEVHTEGNWTLIVRCDLKNYNDEIECLVQWLDQYIDGYDGEMIGYSRYEEDREPTILYKSGDYHA